MIERKISGSGSKLLATYVFISSPTKLQNLIATLNDYPVIAVDTESDSLYSYFEKVCLVQISTPETDYIVDPLAVDISPMATIFSAEHIQKIFHAAEYDILSLKRDYGFEFSNLFDTMVSAKILGWQKVGLGSLLETHLHVKLNKKFQQYNWGKRPLSPQALNYAYRDTHYLHTLRQIQLDALAAQNRLSEARAAFKRLTRLTPTAKVFSPADFWRVRGAKNLSSEEQAVLQAVFIFRDDIARYYNIPPFKLMSDAAMCQLAQTRPKTVSALKKVRGIHRTVLKTHPRDLIALLQATPPEASRHRRHTKNGLTNAALARYEHLRAWRNALAAKRGVEPNVILPNDALKAIARLNPATIGDLKAADILGDWQFSTYAAMVIEKLKTL